ncbi:MAG: nucleotidyltransferase domain-containing protein [Palaeococcus sp.]|uniref:nucleotidyltransferase domain-containing protein n=1 Tax=Palaeococcus sp. (in: euryarchaeotes) TaxID=2820298 RepID=UPI0025EFB2FD|nr:nucleotidyltransferase domain-containing protein [Palaeococcus sp. (in: euryarchaeotes)]MCD6559933.1 nucleotidyltransferase domain-containing protein [Palaeococcus sp. (in: euryarchaeotes)]
MLSDLRKRLSEIAREFASENPNVWDILLYGSVMKGKEKPNDVDIAVIAREGNPFEVSFEFKRLLEERGLSPDEVDVKGFLLDELFDENNLVSFALLVEGYSLLNGKFLHERLNAKGYFLFRFSYSSLSQSQKMRFLYAYRGRNGSPGLLKQTNAMELAPGVVLVPVGSVYKFKEFLSLWRLSYELAPVLIGEFTREVPSLE